MASKNAVESILVVAHTQDYCKYFINNGEQHLCSYDKIRQLLMEVVPNLALQIEYFLERKLSFFITVPELKIQQVTIDLQTVIEQMKKDKFELNTKNLYKFMNSEKVNENAPKYQSQVLNIQRKMK